MMTFKAPKAALIAIAGAMALSACATQDIYRPMGVDGSRSGYAEQRIEADRFRVSFQGNSLTSRERVETGLLLRSAELTRENGYDWFATLNRATDRDTRMRFDGGPMGFRSHAWHGGPFWGTSWRFHRGGHWSQWRDPFWGMHDMDVRQIDRFEASAEIVMGRGPKPDADPNAFDASEVIRNLGPRFSPPAA